MQTPLIELTRASLALRRGLTRRQASEDHDHFKTQGSFDFDEVADEDFNADKIEEVLRRFRESGRFEYNHEHKNYFEIKYW